LIILIISGKEYKLSSPSLCDFLQPPVISAISFLKVRKCNFCYEGTIRWPLSMLQKYNYCFESSYCILYGWNFCWQVGGFKQFAVFIYIQCLWWTNVNIQIVQSMMCQNDFKCTCTENYSLPIFELYFNTFL
jgi:hypothetical protein